MYNAGEIRSTTKPSQQHWLGVWGIRNFYHKLEIQARGGADINFGYIFLVMAASLLATGGLLANSAAVVIGSMCVAPFLGPSRAVCIGALYLDRKVFWKGLVKQLLGLFIFGAGFAYLVTLVLKDLVPDVLVTHEILIRSLPTSKDVVLAFLIAVAAGAGASLAFTADPHVVDHPWGQLLDVMIGVEIAISLIPPAAVVGIGLALGDPRVSRSALALLAINIVALDVLGSMLIFLLRGMRRRHFDLERGARQIAEAALESLSPAVHAYSVVDVTLLDENQIKVEVVVRGHQNEVPADLAMQIGKEIQARQHCRCEVALEIMPGQFYSTM